MIFGTNIAICQETGSEFKHKLKSEIVSHTRFRASSQSVLESSKKSQQKTKWQKVKLFGFTLAEILITLGIIGIIASATIPTLMNNTNDKELKTAWKKNYANFSNITNLILNDQGTTFKGIFAGDVLGTEALKDVYKAKLAIIKDCKGDTSYGGTGTGNTAEGCWHASGKWRYLNGTIRGVRFNPGLILKDGTLVYFTNFSSNCTEGILSNRCAAIDIDVNGFKGPNTVGKDIYSISIADDFVFPDGAKGFGDPTTSCIERSTASTNYGWTCSAKNLYN